MLSKIRNTLSIVLSWLLVLTPALAAQQTSPTGAPQTSSAPRQRYSAPVPSQVLHAHRIFVANGGGSNYFEIFSGGTNRAYNTFYKDLKRTRRYDLVSSPAQADLIFEIRAIAPSESSNDNTYYNPQILLTIRDPQTTAVLWRESANVRVFGTRKRRDRQLDQAVAVLVDKLAVVTGQPLTRAQTKAIAANSNARMSTTAIVFTVTSVAVLAGMIAWGVHRANNPPKLNPPPPPTLP